MNKNDETHKNKYAIYSNHAHNYVTSHSIEESDFTKRSILSFLVDPFMVGYKLKVY